ncbi:MAG: DEAD/DEAH box helicase [Acidobacteriota bacterium]
MFVIDEIKSVLNNHDFISDLQWVRQSLAMHRYGQKFPSGNGSVARLSYFVESVLSSAPGWKSNDALNLCSIAGEIAELLSSYKDLSEITQRKMRIRSALLYELAELPALSSAILKEQDLTGLLGDLFSRKGFFSNLGVNGEMKKYRSAPVKANVTELDLVLSYDALRLAEYEQGEEQAPDKFASQILANLAKELSIGMSTTEINAFAAIINKRRSYATRSNVEHDLLPYLREMKFPAELWATQVQAIQAGLVNYHYDSWGFAAPTGTGKTFLARLLIAKTLLDNPETKILYIVPSKALVQEICSELSDVFAPLNFSVVQVSPQMIELNTTEEKEIATCSVAVLTPEKADLLLRLGVDFMANASLIIVDEAHHIESGNRGVLLELYLWRIRNLYKVQTRIVFLSAVAPNVDELAEWLGDNPGGLVADRRSTRMRAGVYHVKKQNAKGGWIDYSDNTSIRIVDSLEKTQEKQLIQLAEKVSRVGPVLIVAKGKGTCESLAKKTGIWLEENGFLKKLTEDENKSDTIQRLDSRLEREMYASVEMRILLKNRIVYHHAGLPPRVRQSVEEAIRQNYVDYVYATTTLAEGVNFPFSSVIVQSLALREPPEKGKPARYNPVTPRSFWNIAGRAGRPGFDREGQAILFEPSLGAEKVNAVVENYLDPSMKGIDPVHSALAENIKEISRSIDAKEFTLDTLETVALPENITRKVRGTINLLRVGIIHAKTSKQFMFPEQILEGSFALRHLDDAEIQIATQLIQSQTEVVDKFLAEPGAPSVDMIAELGLSIETLSDLRDYVLNLSNWELKQMRKVMIGGKINFNQAKYIVGPVAKRMAELEGPKLGGLYTEVILQWLSGVPLVSVKSKAEYKDSLEELIKVIYSRIQYLLPWGLYAFHRLVEEELKRRNIFSYSDEILSLAYLVDAGVPNYDALRLVRLDMERVDATRLAKEYHKRKPYLDTDIIGWLLKEDLDSVLAFVRGSDNRRIDPDLIRLLNEFKGNSSLMH